MNGTYMDQATTFQHQVEPLTGAAFARYGQCLGRPARPADIEKGWLGYWHALGDIGLERQPVWGYLEVRRRPAVLEEMERHCHDREVFIPLGPDLSVMAFAAGGRPEDPAATPDPATLRFFLIDGTQAFVVNAGTWHCPAFPLGAKAGFLLALESSTPEQDIDARRVGPYRVSLHTGNPEC